MFKFLENLFDVPIEEDDIDFSKQAVFKESEVSEDKESSKRED